MDRLLAHRWLCSLLMVIVSSWITLAQSGDERAARAEAARLTAEAVALYNAGELAPAEPLLKQALTVLERALGAEHPEVATSLNNLAALYYAQSHYAEAEALHKRVLAIREQTLGVDHPDVAVSLNNLAVLYRAQGRDAQAEPLYRRALAVVEQALGPEHPLAARSLNNLANLLEQSQPSHARLLYQQARRIFLRVAQVNADLHDEALRGLLRESQQALQANMAFLAKLARQSQSPPTPMSPAWEAFEVGEQLRGGAAHMALAQAGARVATGSPTTAQLARQVQDMRQRWQAVRTQLTAEYGKSAPQRNATRVAQLQQDERQLDDALAAATRRLRTAFPQYAALVMPEPIELAAVTALLQPHEALVSFFTLPDRLLLWLVRPEQQPVYRDIDVTKAAVEGMLHRVRLSLDQVGNPALGTGQVLPFDVEGAHALYTLLLAPLREHLAGVTHLLIVPDEVWLPLPFGVLVTKAEGEAYQTLADLYRNQFAPAPGELLDYARIAWLARDYTLTVLPAATSLRALRQLERAKVTAIEPFIGFGDPLLQGTGMQRGGSMLASRGTAIAFDAMQRMNRLPATRDELLAVATALGADPHAALYLDTQATETQVRELNSTGRLGQARVLAFATHGLLAGEVTGLTQPALVLTPPSMPNDQDDGLLSLDDILELKLFNTDWVILSACNTGAADRSGEGLSGLTRAFFFAGARSLLVSHWSVDDRATQALMTAVFRRQASTPTLAPAAALQQGMLALLAEADGDTAYFAHPYAWAPFFLVGEGR